MAKLIESGVFAGHPIRRARKEHQCDGYRNMRGHTVIKAGSLYVEGFVEPYRAGGFGHSRLCACCVDDGARAALAKAEAA